MKKGIDSSASRHNPGQPITAVGDTQAGPGKGAGLLIDGLAKLPDQAMIDEKRLAHLLGLTSRTIRRIVSRFELPPPTRLAGRSIWLAGRVLAHIEAAAERAEQEARHHAEKIRRYNP